MRKSKSSVPSHCTPDIHCLSAQCSMKTLKKFEETIDERIAELCDKIKQRSAAHEAVDFSEYVR